ncbi:MAG: sensor domain-containing diguanylate cyclase [Gallionellaceae bacterium]|jgi:diguanylate cyclase (GGDEF)-like protein/PAS domain S-box-containing protein
MSERELQAEITRLNKIIQALMNRAELNENAQDSDFNLFHTAIVLEEQVRQRTGELEASFRENERITRALRESENKFRALVDQSLVGITLIEGDRFVYVNPKFSSIVGYSSDELLKMGPLDISPEQARPRTSKLMRRWMAGLFNQDAFVVNVLCKDGSVVNVEISGGSPITIGGKLALMAVWADVTERVRVEREVQALNLKLREQAIHDPLTGLFNRRYLQETLDRELALAERHGYAISLVMGDIDFFKKVNDTHGHQAGDEVLRAFGALIKGHSRSSDICCRYGGEEFLLVMPNVPEEKAFERAEQLRLAIEVAKIVYEGTEIQVTASFGIAAYPVHGDDSEAVLAAADAALYEAKNAGRNQVKRYSKPAVE